MKTPWWVWPVGIGIAGYALYVLFQKIPKLPTPGQIASKLIDWLALPFINLPPAMQVLGNVVLPTGTMVPLNTLENGQIRQDLNQSPPAVYANVSGSIYQLAPSDANGNYPAVYVQPAPPGA